MLKHEAEGRYNMPKIPQFTCLYHHPNIILFNSMLKSERQPHKLAYLSSNISPIFISAIKCNANTFSNKIFDLVVDF